jgi:hypothetical protein
MMFDVEIWGTVSSWFGVLGTVASVGTAAFYYVRSQRLEEYAQARHVRFVSDLSDDSGFHARVFNFSDESIFDVTPTQERTWTLREVLEREARRYSSQRVSDERIAELHEEWSVAPGGILHVQSHDGGHIKAGGDATFVFKGRYSAAQDYSVSFRDAMARTWCLDLDISRPHRMHDERAEGSYRLRDVLRHPGRYIRHRSKERELSRWLDTCTIEDKR